MENPMRKILALIVTFSLTSAIAQQLPQYSQYMRNQYMVNPGAAGVYDFVDITAGGRMQWLGFDDAPKTAYLYAATELKRNKRSKYNPSLRTSHGPVRNPEVNTGRLKHALGGQVVADEYGAFRHLRAGLTYAIHMPLSRDYNLSFGTTVGFSNRAFIQERAQTLNMINGIGTDATYDQYAAQGDLNTIDVGAGLYFYSKRLFVGLAANQLTEDYIRIGSNTVHVDPRMHFNITAGYKFDLNNNLTLTPSVLAKYIYPSPLSIEGSVVFEYKEWLWYGLSYRNTDAVIGMVGLNVSQRFKFGYSFDFSVSRFNQYSSGGHEVVLGIMLGR